LPVALDKTRRQRGHAGQITSASRSAAPPLPKTTPKLFGMIEAPMPRCLDNSITHSKLSAMNAPVPAPLLLNVGKSSGWLVVIITALVCFGCRKTNEIQGAADRFTLLQKTFNVGWPSNSSETVSASWDYRALLDGNSKNTEIIARLKVDHAEFHAWRSKATNVLKEYKGFGFIADPSLTKRCSWWVGSHYPTSMVDYYSVEIDRNPKHLAKLYVYAIKEAGSHTMFIHGHILER
jgi:hypothetical protein